MFNRTEKVSVPCEKCSPIFQEPLENRILLSAAVQPAWAILQTDGIVAVAGDGGNDHVILNVSSDSLVIRLKRGVAKARFSLADVKGVNVNARGGDDSIINQTSLPSTLIGGPGNDSVTGGTGGDVIGVDEGHNVLNGGGGTDSYWFVIHGAVDAKAIQVNPGNIVPFTYTQGISTIVIEPEMTLRLTSLNDSFEIDDADDYPFDFAIDAGAGDDNLSMRNQTNSMDRPLVNVTLGSGDDLFSTENVYSHVYGNAGNDQFSVTDLHTATDPSSIDGGSGVDTVTIEEGVAGLDPNEGASLSFYGGNHTEFIYGPYGINSYRLYGNDGNNKMGSSALRASLYGMAGDDTLYGSIFDDGGKGNDHMLASFNDASTLVGGAGDDTLIGSNGGDSLDGGTGDDSIVGNAGNDTMIGGLGQDTMLGGYGNDKLFAQDGEVDSLDGGAGSNKAQRDKGPIVFDSVMNIEKFIA